MALKANIPVSITKKFLKEIQERSFEMFRTAESDDEKTIWLDLVNAAERAMPLCKVEEKSVPLVERKWDKERMLLINPGSTEQIDFHPEDGKKLEVWMQFDKNKGRWKEKVEYNGPTLQKRSDFFIHGASFQRFNIFIETFPSLETKFLGAVIFQRAGGAPTDAVRISCWSVPNPHAPTYTGSLSDVPRFIARLKNEELNLTEIHKMLE